MEKLFFYICCLFLTSSVHAQWTAQTSGTTETLNDVFFQDANNGWVVGDNQTLLRTNDAGANWSLITPPALPLPSSGFPDDLEAIQFVDANTGWIAVRTNGAYKTTDGGNSWTFQTIGSGFFTDVYFSDANNGWLVGGGGSSPFPGIVYHTSDGGMNWTPQTIPASINRILEAVFFVNSTTGWAVGRDGQIISTTNGGMTWTQQTSGTTSTLNNVFFTSPTEGWVVTNTGEVLQTSNGGANWSPINLTSSDLNGLYFVDANTGWAVGWNNQSFTTTNGGMSWTPLIFPIGADADMEGVFFLDATTGWTVGARGEIYYTINAGLPVEFTYFAAKAQKNGVALSWQTATETNNAGFEVQRLVDSGQSTVDSPQLIEDGKWEVLTFVKGHGTTVETQNYSYLDKDLTGFQNLSGLTLYYRLRQVDHDGAFEYSEVIAVNAKSTIDNKQLHLFPNPVEDVLNYQVADLESVQRVQLFDVNGKLLRETTVIDGQLSLNALPKGVYLFVLETASGQLQQRVVKE